MKVSYLHEKKLTYAENWSQCKRRNACNVHLESRYGSNFVYVLTALYSTFYGYQNLELEKTAFLSKSNSAFIEDMYMKFVNNDPTLADS